MADMLNLGKAIRRDAPDGAVEFTFWLSVGAIEWVEEYEKDGELSARIKMRSGEKVPIVGEPAGRLKEWLASNPINLVHP